MNRGCSLLSERNDLLVGSDGIAVAENGKGIVGLVVVGRGGEAELLRGEDVETSVVNGFDGIVVGYAWVTR